VNSLPLAPLECDLKIKNCPKCDIEILYNRINCRMVPIYCRECDK